MCLLAMVAGLVMQKSSYEAPKFFFQNIFLAFLQDLTTAGNALETRMFDTFVAECIYFIIGSCCKSMWALV